MTTAVDDLTTPKRQHIQHYYGDVVRVMFIAAGLLMLISLPYFTDLNLIPVPLFVAVGAILLVSVLAGVMNPLQPVLMFFNLIVSLSGFAIFESYAVESYLANQALFFLVNQLLAALFFFALYYSTKTLRGYFLRKKQSPLSDTQEIPSDAP